MGRFLTLVLCLFVLVSGCAPFESRNAPSPQDSGPPWLSGVWLGGELNNKELAAFGRWRAAAADTATTYPAYETWQQIAQSDWHVSTFHGSKGRLVYGLPLLLDKGSSTLKQVGAGQDDAVWRAVAQTLLKHGRGTVSCAWASRPTATGFVGGANAATAADYKAAYRHVVQVMSAVAPDLEFVGDISCGVGLSGRRRPRRAAEWRGC